MALKRKDSAPHAALPRPAGVRRSSRRTKGSSDVKQEKHDDSSSEAVNSRGRGRGLRKGEAAADRGVDSIMKELSAMEEKFQTAIRTQRLAVESSDLRGNAMQETRPQLVEEQPLKSTKAFVNELPAPDRETTNQGPLTGHDAGIAAGDIADAAAEEVDAPDRGARRPPPVNSSILPLPWTGRLGYACLNTYLRSANPAVFSSRTCRISSILEHRHPLQDPTQPEHPTKNRPDKTEPADVARGMKYVQDLGIANAKDIVKMLRWNDKYGIKFMRLSSEMFPFASHQEFGYKLAPFASEVLAEAGKVAAELGHRLTTHPGQFTQIGSPRKEVVTAAIRDLEYHDELLSLLKLPEQADRDAVMILHMGGTYGDKPAALDRFRENYKKLPTGVKNRLVLENDDVAWNVHELLPICEELSIPFVLDFHHHNILFDPCIREGTQDIIGLFDRIRATWTRKNIRQKMHYSEQTASAVTPRDRRKHSPRVKTLPPCPPDMDLMIEAKDKEQAVFDLMRHFRLPGWDLFNDIVPHERDDESRKEVKKKAKKTPKKKKKDAVNGDVEQDGQSKDQDDIEIPERIVSEEDFGMGGPENRVFWPEGMEEWLKPKKREVKKTVKEEDK